MGLAYRLAVLATAAIALLSCSQITNTAVPEEEALQDREPLRQSKPIASIVRDYNINPPDPRAPRPLLQQLVAELRKADPDRKYEGVTYKLSEHNELPDAWLVQTPNWWNKAAADLPYYQMDCPTCLPEIGLPRCTTDADCGKGLCKSLAVVDAEPSQAGQKVCVGHSDELIDRLYRTVAAARYRVDITALQPPPDGRFLVALRRALMTIARTGNVVTVRVLVGQYPPTETDANRLLKEMTRGLQEIPRSKLSVHVGAMRTCFDPTTCGNFSWNHSKMVVVDGRTSIVGGHNMWTRDYLLDRPIHDLSMAVNGPAAFDTSGFVDKLWHFVCTYDSDKRRPVEVRSLLPGDTEPGTRCAAPHLTLNFDRLRRPGNVPVVAIGRLGAGMSDDFVNHGDLARDLMLGAAQQTIRIVQQDFGFTFGTPRPVYAESTMERIVDFALKDQGDAFIVLSNYRARGKTGSTYSNRLYIEDTARKFQEIALKRSARPDDEVNAILCRRLAIAPFRFSADETWPENIAIGNHAKFYMTDDRAFYIGSDNFYPVDLQEFGYIVDSRQAAVDVHRQYWDPLWRWSSPFAISGKDAKRCIFTEPLKQPAATGVKR